MERSELALLDDQQLQTHIEHCGQQMLAANTLGMQPERGNWLKQQEAALRERASRPHLVAAMEQAKGISA